MIALFVLFQARDRIVAMAPGLAVMLPAKAVPPAPPKPEPILVPADKASTFEFDAGAFAMICLVIGVITGGIVLPAVVPPILSRKGYLSVGRWLIFAGLAFFLLSLATGIAWVEGRDAWGNWTLRRADSHSLATLPCVCAVIGCLVAAAIHPKPSL